jgi:hypothetical protein
MAYVYRHIRLDKNEPFYIGVGSDDVYKRANDTKGRNKIWNDIVKKTDYEVEILFDNVSWDYALNKEIEFIDLYKRKTEGGTLSNITKGGEGVLGLKHKKETKEKLSKRFKGVKHTPEAIEKIRQTSKRPCSEEKKIKLSLANKGQKMTAEQREKLRISSTGRKLSETAKEKLRIANTGKKYSEETREKIRNVVKEIWRKRKEANQ